MSINTAEDVYASVGYGNVTVAQVMTKLREFHKEHYKSKIDTKEDFVKANVNTNEKKNYKPTQGVTVKGIDNLKVRFSRCCSPVPGDDIVGYVTRGRGVSVHRKDCPNLESLDIAERFIDVDWATNEKSSYSAEIQVKATDRTGLLTEITQILSDAKLSVTSLNARTSKEKVIIMNMTLEIKDIDQLKELMKKIKRLNGVMDVYRVIT